MTMPHTTTQHELLARLGEAAIREHHAREAVALVESRAAGIVASREARAELNDASRALQALIAEARS